MLVNMLVNMLVTLVTRTLLLMQTTFLFIKYALKNHKTTNTIPKKYIIKHLFSSIQNLDTTNLIYTYGFLASYPEMKLESAMEKNKSLVSYPLICILYVFVLCNV